jgi:hypothetical protein
MTSDLVDDFHEDMQVTAEAILVAWKSRFGAMNEIQQNQIVVARLRHKGRIYSIKLMLDCSRLELFRYRASIVLMYRPDHHDVYEVLRPKQE